MTGEGLFVSTLNYHRNDREQILNTIPLDCVADLNSAIGVVPCLEGKYHSSSTLQEIKIPCVEERGQRAIISPVSSTGCRVC